MIISLHTPKSGGSSFRELLVNHYGVHFREDYSDQPIGIDMTKLLARTKRQERYISLYKQHVLKFNKVSCIHGHFLAYKYKVYLKEPGVSFVTWLRDPAERLASHYFYWKRTLDQFEDPHPLHRRMMAEKWSLEDFCFSNEMKNIYSRFLWDFPIENFKFVGITEHFEDDMKYFARQVLKIQHPVIPTLNANKEKEDSYFRDEEMLVKIKEFHANDYELYSKALQMRINRNS